MNSEINNIYNICKHIADNRHSTEVNILFGEEKEKDTNENSNSEN